MGLAVASLAPFLMEAQEGPQSKSGDSVAKPKKPAEAPADQPAIPSEYKRPKDVPPPDSPTFEANATTVNVDVAVMDDHNRFIPKIPQGAFRVVEDGVPQQITRFGQSEAPMTICMLIEFSGRFQAFWSWGWEETLQASYGFLSTLKEDDNVAIVAYDLRPTILSDFSPDKRRAEEAMSRLRIPGFSESNVYDALLDTVDRLKDQPGKKAILLIATGRDTFSKHTYDQTMKALHQTDVPIFVVGLSQVIMLTQEMRGRNRSEIDFLQDENQMKTFAHETGGNAWFPRFTGEIPGVFQEVAAFLRNQYSLTYSPTNRVRDGKFRKVKVELVAPDGSPLTVLDQKGKKQKYVVYAREGYVAPKGVD